MMHLTHKLHAYFLRLKLEKKVQPMYRLTKLVLHCEPKIHVHTFQETVEINVYFIPIYGSALLTTS